MGQETTAVLTSTNPSLSFSRITGIASSSDGNLANLSTENYPDRPQPIIHYISTGTCILSTITTSIPQTHIELANLPNRSNQDIFKVQPLQWWVDNLNAGSIIYTPYSNKVSWSYITVAGDKIHITSEITNVIFPKVVLDFQTDSITRNATATFVNNGYMSLKSTYVI
jgi:hypothetical protein